MNELIKNYATGDQIEFLESAESNSGQLTKFIMTLAPHSSWAKWPRHYHPYQTETFKVLEGVLHLTKGNHTYKLHSDNKKVIVKPFELHSFWNSTNKEVKFMAEIYPPVNIEKGLRMTYRLSEQGKINKNNIPTNPFYTLILMNYFDSYFPFFPWKMQKFFFRQGAKLSKFFLAIVNRHKIDQTNLNH